MRHTKSGGEKESEWQRDEKRIRCVYFQIWTLNNFITSTENKNTRCVFALAMVAATAVIMSKVAWQKCFVLIWPGRISNKLITNVCVCIGINVYDDNIRFLRMKTVKYQNERQSIYIFGFFVLLLFFLWIHSGCSRWKIFIQLES